MAIHIDYTSLFGAYMALDCTSLTAWALNSYSDLTCLLLAGQRLVVPPPAVVNRVPELNVKPLLEFMTETEVTGILADMASERTAKRVPHELGKLKDSHALLWDVAKERDAWIQWHSIVEWPDHIGRVKGMVQKSDIPAVSFVSGISQERIKFLNEKCYYMVNTSGWDPDEFSDDLEFLDVSKVWSADLLIRTIFYDELARAAGGQYVMHSARRFALPPYKVGEVISGFQIIPTLAAMIGNYARQEKNSTGRLLTYIDAIKRVKKVLNSDYWAQKEHTEHDGTQAIDAACEVLRRADLIPHWRPAPFVEGIFVPAFACGAMMILVPVCGLNELEAAEWTFVIESVLAYPAHKALYYGIDRIAKTDANIKGLAGGRWGYVFSNQNVGQAI
jgi:hypothetical protein